MILKRNHHVSDSNEDFKKMPQTNKILLNDINDRITCALCKGYFIDATTIIECLHTFCRSCIVKYLETHKYCPICDVQVHKTKPLANIRPDRIIQDIVYKLVPRLYHDEMRRRGEFYSTHTEGKPSALEEKNEVTYEYILNSDENVCVALNYSGFSGSPRYLKCPAAVTIGHLEKLIIGKYDLSPKHRVTIFYNDDALNSHSTLMEIAYIYSWRRKGPLELTYRIYENRTKRLKLDAEESSTASANNNNNNWKEVQLRISENGEISVTGIRDDVKDAVDDLSIVITDGSEDEEKRRADDAPGDEKMDVDEPVSAKGHKKLSNGSKRNDFTGVLKVAKVRIRKVKSPKSKEKKEKKAKRGRRKKTHEEDEIIDLDEDSKKDVNKNLEESAKPVNSVAVEEIPEDSTQQEPSGNLQECSANRPEPGGNQQEPSRDLQNDKQTQDKGEICKDNGTSSSDSEDKTKKSHKLEHLEIGGNEQVIARSPQPPVITNQPSDHENDEKSVENSRNLSEKSRELPENKPAVEDVSLKSQSDNNSLDNSASIVDKKTKDLQNSEEQSNKISEESDKALPQDLVNSHNDTASVPEGVDSQESTEKTTQNAANNRKESNGDSQVKTPEIPSGNQQEKKSREESQNQHDVNKTKNDENKSLQGIPNPPITSGKQIDIISIHSLNSKPVDSSEKLQTTNSGIPNVFSEFKTPVASTRTVTASCTLTASTLTNSSADLRRAKHKIDEKPDYEPLAKQPTILNHTLGLQNLSNNHPLKKHALSKPDVATNCSKPVKAATSAPCYMPRTTVYSPVINVPKPQTSTQAKTNDTGTPKKEKTTPATILNSKVLIKPKPSAPSMGYKTLRDPPKSWNPQIARPALNRNDPKSPAEQKNSRPLKFFKIRNNLPRYLGNPASGVKPMYQLHVSPDKDKSASTGSTEQPPKTEIKKHSIVKIDPKTLKPISERAPETSNLCRAPEPPDLKINTSSVSIFNPLKLQSGGSPKGERKSPHSPKVKGTSTSPTGRKDRVNLNFTPSNPFIPNLASPTMSPNQFLFPTHPQYTSYDPRVMAAYQSFYSRLPFVSHLGINLDMARKSFEMAKANVPLASLPSTSSSPAPQPKNNVKKKEKSEKSLQNAVEKLTQNKIKEAKLETTTTTTTPTSSIGKENADVVDKKTETDVASPPSGSVPVSPGPETKK